MRTRLTMLSIAILCSVAHADAVQTLVDEATALYERADLAGALEKLETAYGKSKRADILFGIARIHVDRGDCAKAIDVYREFLESKPGPRSTQIATEKIAECQAILARTAPAPEPTPEPAAPRTRTVQAPWYTDVVGDVLLVGGLGALGASTYFALGARADIERADQGGAGGVTLADYATLRDRAHDRTRYAWIAGGAGGALVIAALLEYSLRDRTEVVPVVTPSGGGVAIGGRF